MPQTLAFLLAALIFLFAVDVSPAHARYASMVVDAETGEVLHAVNADTQKYPASLTKIMTLYMLFDEMKRGRFTLDSRLAVSVHASRQSPSRLGLKPGQSIRVEDAVLALVTKSANDVAVVVAEAIGGSEDRFGELMTARARQLGMKRTTFRNASGLPNKGQLSTARDMVTLARALLRNHGDYYHYFSTRSFSYGKLTMTTHNRLMLNYPGADGIKTGYIAASGFNLVASAKRNGRRLVGVVFGGQSARARDAHMADLLDAAFAKLPGQGPTIDNLPEVIEANAGPEDDQPDLALAQGKASTAARSVTQPGDAKDVMQALAATKAARPYQTAAKIEQGAPAKKQASARADDDTPAASAGKWGIQVGAFTLRDSAANAAERATEKLGNFLTAGRVDVSSYRGDRRTLYRARVVGLSESQAREACKRLSKQKTSCSLVTPSGSEKLASLR